MTDPTTTTEPTAETPKRKAAPRRKNRVAVVPPKPSGEFEGMTGNDCSDKCIPARCVITGVATCGHPMKGGLQAAFMVRLDVLKRYNRAKRLLAGQKLDISHG